jgi:RNA polymerase sigma-70 factor (ECF subfamily)
VGWTELCLELETVTAPEANDDQLLPALNDCLQELGPSARQAIELHYRSERRLSEIGAVLHRSEGAVKILLHRARQALRDCLLRRRHPGHSAKADG